MVLRANELQLTRGESVRDTALVFSRHVAAIGLRTCSDERLEELAEHATVPVVNMLSPLHHPCQALADLMTLREAFGAIDGPQARLRRRRQQRRALAGDRRRARRRRGRGRRARRATSSRTALGAQLTADPAEAVAGADAVYTDVWVSMSDAEDEAAARRAALAPYRLDDALLDRAAPGAFALHCLPAHPGEEITEAVLYGDRAADLGPGGEPPARLQGAARARSSPGRVRGHARPASRQAAPSRSRRPPRARRPRRSRRSSPGGRARAARSASSTRARSWC